MNPNSTKNSRPTAFTLIELLVVISIIGLLAGFTLVGLKSIGKTRKISAARAELQIVQTALENYKAKYGTYPPSNRQNALLQPLYYELAGVTAYANLQPGFKTLDASESITLVAFTSTFNLPGLLNSTKGSGDDSAPAKNFIIGFKNSNFGTYNGSTKILVSAAGSDDTYLNSLAGQGFSANPIRYANPGTNNPGGYDLWIKLVINGQNYVVCNWTKTVLQNSTLP